MTKGSVPSTGFHVEQNSDLTVNKSHDIGMQCIQSICLGYWVLKIIFNYERRKVKPPFMYMH